MIATFVFKRFYSVCAHPASHNVPLSRSVSDRIACTCAQTPATIGHIT